ILEVAKFELTPVKCIGIFKGGGLTLAEKKVKGQPEVYGLAVDPSRLPNLDDLSCRWKPTPSRHGSVFSLLFSARGTQELKIYQQVICDLEKILGNQWEDANPVALPQMSYKGLWENLKDEVRYYRSGFSAAFFKKILGICVAVISLKFRIHPGIY